MNRLFQYTCCLILLCCAARGEVRVFMAPEGAQQQQPTSGPTSLVMMAGDTVRVMVWVEDTNRTFQELNAYQVLMPWFPEALGATGSLQYVDNNPGQGGGDSILVDTTRDDFVFSDALVILMPVYNETPQSAFFGCIYNSIPGLGTVVAGTGIRYLFEFEYSASTDACGLFEARFRIGPKNPPLSALFLPGGAEFVVDEFQPLHIDVLCPGCAVPCEVEGSPRFSIPPDGSIDPSGAAGPDGVGGTDTIAVVFTAPAVVDESDFVLEVTDGTAPVVANLRGDDVVVELLLDRPIPAGACTTLTHPRSGWVSQIRSLPGDVNGDAITTPIDILTLIDDLNGVTRPPLPTWQCDIDRSGVCNGLDILRLVDLLNGAGGGVAWNGVEAPVCP